MDVQELAELGLAIVEQANRRQAAVRLSGPVAVWARCPSIKTHPALQGVYSGLDFIAPVEAWHVLPDLFIGRGFRMKVNSRDHATFKRDELIADVRGTLFRDYFQFDLHTRLMADSYTLSLADLLLCRLQRVRMTEEDVRDSIALLLDHPAASGGDSEAIDRDYLYWRTYQSWGLWTAVYDNLVYLEKVLDRYLDLREAERAWRGVEAIQEVMDGKHKALGWWLRSIPNKRIKWYTEPITPRGEAETVWARPLKPVAR